jgi:hypothetical protein
MTWHYSLALAEEFWAACSAGTALSAPWKLIPTADLFLCEDKTMDTFHPSRFGMTYALLTEEHGEELLTWFQGDSLAKISVPPETEPVLPAKNPHSGLRCSESFGRYDQSTSSWKTPPDLFGEGSTLSSADFPKSGTMQSGVCWERMMSVPRISESDAGFSVGSCKKKFPTPTAQDAKNRTNPSQYRRPSLSLAAFVKKSPTAMWRTPIASSGGRCVNIKNTHQIKLADQVGGKLNPDWVELLMGFPIGWTAINNGSANGKTFVKKRLQVSGAETGNRKSPELPKSAPAEETVSKDSVMPKSRSAPQSLGLF